MTYFAGEWLASVITEPITNTAEVRLGRPIEAGRYQAAVGVSDDGHLIMEEVDGGVSIPPFVRIPYPALLAVVNEVTKDLPPTDVDSMREALTLERQRVDQLIGAAIRSRFPE